MFDEVRRVIAGQKHRSCASPVRLLGSTLLQKTFQFFMKIGTSGARIVSDTEVGGLRLAS